MRNGTNLRTTKFPSLFLPTHLLIEVSIPHVRRSLTQLFHSTPLLGWNRGGANLDISYGQFGELEGLCITFTYCWNKEEEEEHAVFVVVNVVVSFLTRYVTCIWCMCVSEQIVCCEEWWWWWWWWEPSFDVVVRVCCLKTAVACDMAKFKNPRCIKNNLSVLLEHSFVCVNLGCLWTSAVFFSWFVLVEVQFDWLVGGAGDKSFIYLLREGCGVWTCRLHFMREGCRHNVGLGELVILSASIIIGGGDVKWRYYFILITAKHDNLASNKRSVGYSCVVHYVSITSVCLAIYPLSYFGPFSLV